MNFKEAIFFIGKCLTINHEEHNKNLVEETLKTTEVDWDNIVRVSTGHFVFPALYCNLKKANFLHYLPDDLVEYMQHITNLNRERNEQIIIQAKEINELLLANNITPIFLKGTGNLLEGLYDDIAERMVGDIDFLVAENEYLSTSKILESNSYTKVHEDREVNFPEHRHYFRLKKEERIAAVEIHRGLTKKKYHDIFNYNHVFKDLLYVNNITFLSYKNQLNLSVIAKQINDDGQYFNDIALRNSYDIFLLSQKNNSLDVIKHVHYTIFKPLNNFLAITQLVLNSNTIFFENNLNTQKTIKKLFENQKKNKVISKKKSTILRVSILYKSIINKEYRKWLLKRISNKKWQEKKLIQIGLKKSKPNL